MSTDIVTQKQQTTGVAGYFNDEQIALITRTIAQGATKDELDLFIQQCKRTGLDPFTRQIYFIKRKQWNKDIGAYEEIGRTQVAIDGARLTAQRSGHYAGQTPTMWCGADGVWVDVWLKPEPPTAARVGVLRDDFNEPLYSVARFDSYAQTTDEYVNKVKTGKKIPNKMWAQMSDVMIAKVAEMLALRRAFPAELSGIYSTEEMGQIENEKPEVKIDVEQYRAKLEACQTLGDLTTVWLSLPVEAKKELETLKNEMKAKVGQVVAEVVHDGEITLSDIEKI